MFGSSFGDLVLRRVLNHRTHCSRSRLTFAMRMPSSSLMYAELWSRFLYKLPSLDVCRSRSDLPVKCVFRCCERSRRVNSERSLGNLPKTKSIHLHGLSKVVVVGFCAWAPFHLVSLLPYCVHLSLRPRTCAPTLYCVRALRAQCQFGRSGKLDDGHVGCYVTDAGAVDDWW